jgi:Tfp pilus assembly protein PilZ
LDGRITEASSEDISMKGIFVVTDDEVRQGDQIELTIAIPDSFTPMVEVKGRVVWVNSSKKLKKSTFHAGFGVELLEFKNATEVTLRNFLNAHFSLNSTQESSQLA